MEEIIDEKIKNARKILLEECMFCLQKFPDIERYLPPCRFDPSLFSIY